METENNESTELIAKNDNMRMMGPMAENTAGGMGELCDPTDTTCENTTSDTGAMGQGGPMMDGGMMGGMLGEMAGTVATTNEWMIPMTATGIIAGSIVAAAVAVCVTLWVVGKKIIAKKD